jgi:hypothetical protein
MKNVLILLALLVCTCPVSADEKDELHVRAVLTTGERSKDSSSETTTITVARGNVVWERTFGGRSGGTPPLRKEFRLQAADERNLRKLIRANNLLVTQSIELPRHGANYRYFEISVDLKLDGEKGAIDISAPRTAGSVREERLYQSTLVLVKELYRMMNKQDKNIFFSQSDFEPIRR